MGAVAIAFLEEMTDDKYRKMKDYLSSEGGYWLNEDKWKIESEAFKESGLSAGKYVTGTLADFTGYKRDQMKVEMKYYLLYHMKQGMLTPFYVYNVMTTSIRMIGENLTGSKKWKSFDELDLEDKEIINQKMTECVKKKYIRLKKQVIHFITDYYDERPEFEKDTWQANRIPGVKRSAAEKRLEHSVSFKVIPVDYRNMAKRFMSRLIVRRSWSYCNEMLIFIKYFFKSFYEHGYENGFLKQLNRKDIEAYLGWVAADYADKNATFRSKSVAYIRQFIDYVQLAEYEQAPLKDVNRLLFDDDIPRRERATDTMGKIKYIPGPVKEQLDASIQEMKLEEMRPVYILLRESGWRGTDILNLRYDNCLEYLWNEREKTYIPYLCGEITKTGIPLLKIPIRQKVAVMVKKLSDKASEISTADNNVDRYLFNTYLGKNKGLPYSKKKFSAAVNELIKSKRILDGDGKLYHFKAHSLRHTRAMEYTEQEMPIGIIQQVLGHCSLQMTLHYSKVSENMLYEKWEKTEKLNLLQLNSKSPSKNKVKEEGLHYEFVRKNLDAVKVPFGVCFKPTKIPCRQQMNHCLECANFCTSSDNTAEYEAEIGRVQALLELSRKLDRDEWVEKNQKYLEILEKMLAQIQIEGTIHKNGKLREDYNG